MNLKKLVLFVGPSGVGKGSLFRLLQQDRDLNLKLSCSVTTRKPRAGEIDGIHYYFVSKSKFEKLIKENKLLEFNKHFENYYGTLFSELERITKLGSTPFLEIETEGAKQVIDYFKKRNQEDLIVSFFIAPPSMSDLEDRLRRRNTEDEDGIELRLEKTKDELRQMRHFQYVIINDNVLKATQEIRQILLGASEIDSSKKILFSSKN